MAKLTPAERKLLIGIDMVDGGFPFRWLRPQLKPVAERLRTRGLLRKRDPAYAQITAAGRAAVQRS